jgi:hypothetical protein
MRHDPGLAASPLVRYIMEVERGGYFPFHLPSAVDGQPPREAAARAYGGTVSPVGSPVGGELLRRQDCLEPQLGAGATLCWIVTLSIAQRGEYEDTFEDPQIVGKWLVGGRYIVLPNPWLSPTPISALCDRESPAYL